MHNCVSHDCVFRILIHPSVYLVSIGQPRPLSPHHTALPERANSKESCIDYTPKMILGGPVQEVF